MYRGRYAASRLVQFRTGPKPDGINALHATASACTVCMNDSMIDSACDCDICVLYSVRFRPGAKLVTPSGMNWKINAALFKYKRLNDENLFIYQNYN